MAFAQAATFLPGEAPASGKQAYEPNIWVRLDADGSITVKVMRAEMGQHVGTALARILADELEADWASVRIEHVDSDRNGDSWSRAAAGPCGRVLRP